MGFAEAVRTCIRKGVTFSGRAPRSEYWWFALFRWAALFFAALVDLRVAGLPLSTMLVQMGHTGPVRIVVAALLILPWIAAGWRRMHDVSRPGWHLLYPFVIGGLLTAFFFALPPLLDLAFRLGWMNWLTEARVRLIPQGLDTLVRAGLLFVVFMQLVVLWWLTRPSTPGENRYGANPHEPQFKPLW